MEKDLKEKTAVSSQGRLAVIIILSVLLIDQIIKIIVKTNMTIGEEIFITQWFRILFVENSGMAFGMELIGKLFLSLFRIVVISLFGWYLVKILNKGFPTGYVVTVAFILAGAAGNLFDSMFYGLIFTESTPFQVAELTGFGTGYAPFLYGKVVDMFYFPLWRWPDWMPLVGGGIFFSPVFNFADSCITCGMLVLIIFYNKVVNMGLVYRDSDEDEQSHCQDSGKNKEKEN
jgi:signal peptidase II